MSACFSNYLRFPSLPCIITARIDNCDWFGDQNVPRRMTASRRYFYVRTHLRTLFGRAIAGIPSGMPVSLDAGSPTLLSARPPLYLRDAGLTLPEAHRMTAPQISFARIPSKLQGVPPLKVRLPLPVFEKEDALGCALEVLAQRGIHLKHRDLSGASLQDLQLRGLRMTCCDLTGADLTGADLRGATLRDCAWTGARM